MSIITMMMIVPLMIMAKMMPIEVATCWHCGVAVSAWVRFGCGCKEGSADVSGS
jgi:hypothetical protein